MGFESMNKPRLKRDAKYFRVENKNISNEVC